MISVDGLKYTYPGADRPVLKDISLILAKERFLVSLALPEPEKVPLGRF